LAYLIHKLLTITNQNHWLLILENRMFGHVWTITITIILLTIDIYIRVSICINTFKVLFSTTGPSPRTNRSWFSAERGTGDHPFNDHLQRLRCRTWRRGGDRKCSNTRKMHSEVQLSSTEPFLKFYNFYTDSPASPKLDGKNTSNHSSNPFVWHPHWPTKPYKSCLLRGL
jgi:hypothetical protein